MKNIAKKMFVGAMALALSAGMVLPASVSALTISITSEDETQVHTFEAYQIFKGDNLGGSSKEEWSLGTVTWGTGVKSNELLAALKANKAFGADTDNDFYNCTDAESVARVVATYTDDSDEAKAFADEVAKHLSNTATKSTFSAGSGYKIDGLEGGYYLVKDEDGTLANTPGSAYTSYILALVYDTTITPKVTAPTVDKSLAPDRDVNYDDFDINESFNFYLTATLPKSDEYADYDKYKVVFTDTMSEGLTYESIEEVKVGETVLTKEQYSVTEPSDGSNKLVVTIDDVKQYASDEQLAATNTKIVVTYKAHLNEKAKVSANGASSENKNEVVLSYSNDPNHETLGKTLPDENYVFTYEVKARKVTDTQTEGKYETPLAGAEFKLYNESGNTEIILAYDADAKVYYPAKDQVPGTGVTITSPADGYFTVKGLDAGTYTLKETKAPDGYVAHADIKIVIDAEIADESGAPTVTIENPENLDIEVVNVKGVNLPSTGAVTLSVVCALAGILAVAGIAMSKKKDEE